LSVLHRWLPLVPSPRLLEIGCGAAEDAGEWLAGGVAEYVGVELDEVAIAQARARWPGLTFLCADAAHLPRAVVGRFHAVLIRRPDLFARPGNWQQVFAVLPALLQPQGRVLVTLLGAGETAVARRWLETNGLHIVAEERWPDPEASYLLVAEVLLARCRTGFRACPGRVEASHKATWIAWKGCPTPCR
jgi:predicted TPR repeat methyltransferase